MEGQTEKHDSLKGAEATSLLKSHLKIQSLTLSLIGYKWRLLAGLVLVTFWMQLLTNLARF
jgi:hypothetical protein